jgi:deoxycytidylate deaminase
MSSIFDNNTLKTQCLSRTQHKYFELAAYYAAKSPMGKQTGVVIVGEGGVIANGYNTYGGSFLKDPYGRTIPICSVHAEIMAVMNAWGPYREKSAKGPKVAQVT